MAPDDEPPLAAKNYDNDAPPELGSPGGYDTLSDVDVRWLTVFLDTPSADSAVAEDFWAQITGTTQSARRGDREEFATLLPPDGDAFMRTQRVDDTLPSCHLDIHVNDVQLALPRALSLGATLVRDFTDYVVLSSPHGFAFCLVPYHGETLRPAPLSWPRGQHSLVDQLCLDIPPEFFATETAFWAALTGWEQLHGALPEFDYLVRPRGMPLRLLLQKLDEAAPAQPVRGHVDFACDDIETEAERHIELGATFARRRSWITLRDPVDRQYCVTDRNPFR